MEDIEKWTIVVRGQGAPTHRGLLGLRLQAGGRMHNTSKYMLQKERKRGLVFHGTGCRRRKKELRGGKRWSREGRRIRKSRTGRGWVWRAKREHCLKKKFLKEN